MIYAREAPAGRQLGEADAITARIGAVTLPLAIIVFAVSTAIHPSREAPMDNPAVFMEYAQTESWIAVHFGQWLGVLLLFGGLVALYYSITTKPEAGAGVVARFGLAAAVLAAASLTMLQAVEGVALKWAVDEWASAPADQQGAAFSAAKALRWTRVCYSELLEHPAGTYPCPLWAGYGVGHHLSSLARVGSRGLWSCLDRPRPDGALHRLIRLAPQGVALVLMSLWAFIMAFVMWRNSSRGRIARP